MTASAVRTTCPYCGVGCGVLASRASDGAVTISGDPDHPANRGRLCSKGSALAETLSLDGRLTHPLIDGKRVSWDTALDRVAGTFAATIAQHGPHSVAFYVSGQLLTEDYYVANKLMKGFIGSANIDTNSRLCMASSVAGHRRAFGSDTVPGTYEDFELADLVVLVGSNLAWCHPVLYQRLAAAREKRGTKVVVIDPRRTTTCELADLHLALAPGTDVALFNGLLTHLAKADAFDTSYIDAHTQGLAAALSTATSATVALTAKTTGLAPADITAFFELFAATPRVVTAYSQGVNQATSGTDKVNAIINCHLATGRIGKPGMGPFSLTGQPNAMGGREVGGLANMLAAHMDIENAAHRQLVQTFWQSPRIADKSGPKAVEMFRQLADGRIKAMWIIATNPVDSMPDADAVRAALKSCPFVVVSDVVRHTDTTEFAHVLLPSSAWGEKDGTVTNSERRISRQRAFMKAPGSAMPDWWQLAEAGRRMGFTDAFNYKSARDIFVEHADLSGRDNDGSRDFNIAKLAALTAKSYDGLAPLQWPQPAGKSGVRERFFAEGGYYTPDRRGRFIATPYLPPASPTNKDFPLVLNTGRIRDQWHTMTRTGKSARLLTHISEPLLEIHPADAAKFELTAGALCVVKSAHGTATLRVALSEQQRRGSVFAPIHWTGQLSSSGRIDAVVAPDVDPFSGQPGLKHTAVSVAPYAAAWYGLVTSCARPDMGGIDHWVAVPVHSGWRVEAAGHAALGEPEAVARGWLGLPPEADLIHYRDDARGTANFAAFDGDRLLGTVFLSRAPLTASRTLTSDQLGAVLANATERSHVLAGRPGSATPDRGAIVCACFGVGENEITAAITQHGCRSVDAIGAALKAGTNCGSCKPEIGKLLHAHAAPA